MVRPYEIVYIIDPDVNETDSAALVERFRALAEAQGAADLRVDTHTIGKRRLAYVIDHKREGHYVVMNFQSEAKAPAEVERVLNITDGILRAMVVRLETMPPEPEPAPAPAPPAPEIQEQPAPAPEVADEPAPAPEIEPEPAEAPNAAAEEPAPAPEATTNDAEEPAQEAVAEEAPAAVQATTEGDPAEVQAAIEAEKATEE